VPGTPVINLVQIFALPAKTEERMTSRDEKKFLSLFHRYCEGLPVNPPKEPHPPSTQCNPEVVLVREENYCGGGTRRKGLSIFDRFRRDCKNNIDTTF
jgi:hypothetical protein